MSTRFQRVLQGARGVSARQKYIDYITGIATRPNRIGLGGNRPNSVKLYVQPFSVPLGATTYVEVSALQPAVTSMQSVAAVSSRVKLAAAVAADTDIKLKLKSFRSARVIRKTLTSGAGTKGTSKLTGLDYLKYTSTSSSIPFGKRNATDSQGTAFADIVQGLGGQQPLIRISLTEERA